jgi:hypothetical protein
MTAALNAPAGITAGELLSVIRDAAANAPRSLQSAVGPSELGAPCDRKLALKLLGAPTLNIRADNWPATVGTAVHTWLADTFAADNAHRAAEGRPPRWLLEQRVTIRPGLSGSCDLYDLETATVIDWKTTGTTRLRKYRAAGDPGQQYRQQAHLYGMGWTNVGVPVRSVAVVFLPRSGVLRDTWLWTEPYDRAVAQAALDRADGLLVAANLAEHAGGLDDLMGALARDTSLCDYCDFYTPDRAVKPSEGCNGPLEDPTTSAAPRQAVAGLF